MSCITGPWAGGGAEGLVDQPEPGCEACGGRAIGEMEGRGASKPVCLACGHIHRRWAEVLEPAPVGWRWEELAWGVDLR